jgi:small subunit ribosomal protein S6
MFLFDSGAARDWAEIEREVRRLCERIGANLLVCVKFDERRLAYEINRRKRGTYALTYFEADAERIADLERDARLSELILRLLVLRAEGLSEEKLKELQARSPEEALAPLGDGRRYDDGPGDRRSRSRDGASRSDHARSGDSPRRSEKPRESEPKPDTAPTAEQENSAPSTPEPAPSSPSE